MVQRALQRQGFAGLPTGEIGYMDGVAVEAIADADEKPATVIRDSGVGVAGLVVRDGIDRHVGGLRLPDHVVVHRDLLAVIADQPRGVASPLRVA